MRSQIAYRSSQRALRRDPDRVHAGRRVDGFRSLTRLATCLAVFVLGGLLILAAGPHLAFGQETPPKDLPEVLDGAVKPDAFYFFDEQGNRVMFPDVSLEEIDRMKKADSGYIQRVKPYTINSIAIEGTADDRSGELTIVTKISVVGTPGRWVEIPLRMEGFHQRGPADVVGVENYKVDTAEDGGVLLWVKTDQPREIELRMRRVVCRVLAEVGQGIRFRLPPAPTTVTLSVRGDDLSASVVGRGDEVVRTSAGTPGETNVNVECSGGVFVLSWRMRDGSRESDQVLEVDCRMRVVWSDPQSPASVVAELDVSNRRGGSLGPFQVVIPENADLIEPLQSNAVAQLSALDPKTGMIQVTPDDSEPLSRLKITFEYRLPSGNYRSEDPLVLFPVEVPSAVRQGGEIEVRTDRNFRLRWKQQPNVRSMWRASSSDPVDIRAYSFQFDRIAFELPLWLTAKQQRLRVEPEYTVRVGRNTATLEARITATGTIIEGVPLVVDAAGWQTVAVEDLENGRSVDDPLGDSGEGLELELGELTPTGNSSVGVLWKAVRPINAAVNSSDVSDGDTDPNVDSNVDANAEAIADRTDTTPTDSTVRFELPTISLPDDRAVIISQGTLTVGPLTGFALIPDLESCEGLTLLPNEASFAAPNRASSSTTLNDASPGGSRFRVLSVGVLPVYQGYLSERNPEADIDANVDLTLDGEVIRVINNWTVKPRGRLQGQLPLIIPDGSNDTNTDNITPPPTSTPSSSETANDWLVRVDGQPAFLRDDGKGRWTLFSERLAGDVCRVQFEAVLPFALTSTNESNDSLLNRPAVDSDQTTQITTNPDFVNSLRLSLPRPALTGTTIGRSAPVSVSAPSDLRVLLGVDSVDAATEEPFNAFADSSLIVRIQKRTPKEATAQVVTQALIRTELGKARRYDRLLARVSGGGDVFQVNFSRNRSPSATMDDGERIIRIWVNGDEVLDFQRSFTGLMIPLKQSTDSHLIDIQIWRPRGSAGMAGMVNPELSLPLSSGKTYWDIVMAKDRHLIWSSAGSSELMLWRYENLFVHRTTTRSYSELLAWIGGPPPTDSQSGNRYLLVTSDPGGFRICEAGRPLLWFSIGGTVLFVSILLFYFPALRHPLLAVAGGVAVGGLAWLAPDLAVISGQLMIAAMLLVALMLGIRAMMSRRPRATVLGGIPDGSSARSVAVRRTGAGSAVGGEAASKRLAETVGSGSAAGAQS